MTSALRWGWVVTTAPGTHCTRGWVGPRAGLDGCGKSRPPPTGIRSPDRPARRESLYRLSYHGEIIRHIERNRCLCWQAQKYGVNQPSIYSLGRYMAVNGYAQAPSDFISYSQGKICRYRVVRTKYLAIMVAKITRANCGSFILS